MKHKHAELMMQYAQDAMETSEPWELWECNTGGGLGWVDMKSHPLWSTKASYCRKPKILNVTLASGEVVSWPEPHRTELEYGDSYFYVAVDGSVIGGKWHGIAWDRTTLSNGHIHLTEEAAKKYSYALFKINNQVAK